MKSVFPVIAFCLLAGISCVKHNNADYKALKAQNDSLLQAKQKLQQEIDDYFAAMNQIEQNIEKIKSTENSIAIKPVGQELDEDTRNKINEDLQYLNDMLQTNKDELARLKRNMKKSALKSTELERSLARLTLALENETNKVALLQTELSAKDSLIAQLNTTITEKQNNVDQLTAENSTNETRIKEQDEVIHTAWYAFGSKEELKKQKIITSGGLFSAQRVLQHDFNKTYFVRIDARKTKSIPLYSSNARILTSHPRSSYTLEKVNDNYVLLIEDPDEFWSISKYLVVEVE